MKIALLIAALSALSLVSPAPAAPQQSAARAAQNIIFRSGKIKISRKIQKKTIFEVSASYPVFKEDSALVRFANSQLESYVRRAAREFAQNAQSDYSDPSLRKVIPGAYSQEITPVVAIARPDLISVYFIRYEYTGGAHPNTDYPAQTFGIVDGKPKQLTLRNLFGKAHDPYGSLTTIALPELKIRNASSVTNGDIKRLSPKVLRNWAVTPGGITLLFAPYDVASYAEGPFLVKCSFQKLVEYLDNNGPLKSLLAGSK